MNQETQLYMPTRIIQGPKCLLNNSPLLKRLGKRALIVTGLTSSKLNGSLEDAIAALENENIRYKIFDQVSDQPTIETVQEAFEQNQREGIEFILGLGKGSAIDAAKAIGVLFRNRGISAREAFNMQNLRSIPIVAVPTIAGSGSEVTPYSIITDHSLRQKKDFGQESFPKIAFLDPRYMYNADFSDLLANGFDAFTHLVEGYLNAKATFYSDLLAEEGFRLFSKLKTVFFGPQFPHEAMNDLMVMATLGGMVIAQTGTGLPHALGYVLTYEKGLAHGVATAAMYRGYLAQCQETEKLERMLEAMGFSTLDALLDYISELMDYRLDLSEEEIQNYTRTMIQNLGRVKTQMHRVTKTQLAEMYRLALRP